MVTFWSRLPSVVWTLRCLFDCATTSTIAGQLSGIQELVDVVIRIFYSRQSDQPNKSNRGLTSDSVEKATKGSPLVFFVQRMK